MLRRQPILTQLRPIPAYRNVPNPQTQEIQGPSYPHGDSYTRVSCRNRIRPAPPKASKINTMMSRRYDAENKTKELPRPCTIAHDSPPFLLPDSATARKTDNRSKPTDDRRRTDAGAGGVLVMVSYPGTPCTEVINWTTTTRVNHRARSGGKWG